MLFNRIGCIMPNFRVTVKYELGRIWKKAVVGILCPEVPRKPTEIQIVELLADKESDTPPPQYKVGELHRGFQPAAALTC
jgi:hypothetical protein